MKIPSLAITIFLAAGGPAIAKIGTQRHLQTLTEEYDIEVIPHFISSSIIDSMKDGLFSDMYADENSQSERFRGKELYLPEEEANHYKELMGSLPVSPLNGQFVPTSKFFQTTRPHKDHTRDSHGNAHLVTASTAFVFMEDNDDAYFTVGGMSIPVVKGSLVRFNGARSHHTIIHSGSVELLGPFEGGWLQSVGWAFASGAPPDFETESPTDVLSSTPTESPTDVLSSTSSKSGKASSSNGTSSPTATKSSKSKADKLFKGNASSSKTSTNTSSDDVSGETGIASIEETTNGDLPTLDFILTSMSMQLADGDGEKRKLINHRPARRRAIL